MTHTKKKKERHEAAKANKENIYHWCKQKPFISSTPSGDGDVDMSGLHLSSRVVLVLALLGAASAQILFYCTEGACKAGCKPVDCDGGRLIQNATTCGCCPICVKHLGKCITVDI